MTEASYYGYGVSYIMCPPVDSDWLQSTKRRLYLFLSPVINGYVLNNYKFEHNCYCFNFLSTVEHFGYKFLNSASLKLSFIIKARKPGCYNNTGLSVTIIHYIKFSTRVKKANNSRQV